MAQFVWSSIDSRCRMLLFSLFRTMQAFRKLLDQLSAVVLISVRSCLLRLEFHFKALLIKLYNSWFHEKTVNLVLLAWKVIQKSYSFFQPGYALWRASARRELYRDYKWQAKFFRYVLGNTVRYKWITILSHMALHTHAFVHVWWKVVDKMEDNLILRRSTEVVRGFFDPLSPFPVWWTWFKAVLLTSSPLLYLSGQ